jgi:dolichol-phosphate mannosyltransferase
MNSTPANSDRAAGAPNVGAADVRAVRFLTALPVYNEARHVTPVLDEVVRHAADVLVVDDGSSDGTGPLLDARRDVFIERHAVNRGYGAALQTAFAFALRHRYDVLVTIDCDGQHEPQRIAQLVAACTDDVEIVSGSRYLAVEPGQSAPPLDRRRINAQITEELNCRFGLRLTDAFCGFKAYRTQALGRLRLEETGYGMPLELWVQAAHLGLRIREVAVPLIYLEEERSFGGSLDDADQRLRYYHRVIDRAAASFADSQRPRRNSVERCS